MVYRATRSRTRSRSRVRARSGSIRRVVGRGNYWTDGTARKVLRGITGGLGGLLGGSAGAAAGPLGAFTGAAGGMSAGYGAGDTISSILGMGDYSVKYNSLIPMKMGTPVPTFGDLRQATVIRHREFIKDIVIPATPANFSNEVFVVNPGNAKTFPWLAQIAANYDQYQFMGCVFNFKSTAGDTATFALGSVVMASDYDVADLPYANKVVMEQSQYCVSGKATVDQVHPIECDPEVGFVPIKYIDHGDVTASGFEKRCTDHCNFQLATVGLPAGTGTIGELWVTYEVALYKPSVPTVPSFAIGQNGVADHYYLSNTWSSSSPLCPFATPPIKRTGSNFNTYAASDLATPTNTEIVLPRGTTPCTIYVTILYVGSVAAVVGNPTITLALPDGSASGQTGAPLMWANGAGSQTSTDAVSQRTLFIYKAFSVLTELTQDHRIHVQTGATLPGTPSFGELMICRMPAALVT